MRVEKRLVKNFTKGRRGRPVVAIVTHIMEGSMAGTMSHFNSPNSKASAHYGISKEGEIVQYVDEDDTAWHAGRVNKPTHPLVLDRMPDSPNLYTIGIEHEGFTADEPTEKMIKASLWLMKDISSRHGFILSRRTLINHREIASDKKCPGKMDATSILQWLAASIGPAPGTRVWSGHFGEHLIVTRYTSDTDWEFVTETSLKKMGVKAGTPFSQMPPAKS